MSSSEAEEVRNEDGPPPGVRRVAFYCDESAIGGNLHHYGFGALVMLYQRRGQFVQEFRELTRNRDWGEVKWNKTSNGNLSYYKRLVDHFFENSWLCFHCIVVKRAWVDVRKYQGSHDLARRKHFTKFLSNKVKQIVKQNPGRKYDFRVYVDPIASSYKKADEAVQVIGNRILQQEQRAAGILLAARASPIEKVFTVDSKERPEIQVCDLLLGAVLDSWNVGSSGQAKADLKDHIAGYLTWQNLRAATYAQERKFNVWWLTDQFKSNEERVVRARPVKLVHPLPPRRNYRSSR